MSTDYSKMSDFDINQAVALLLGLDVKHYQDRSGDMVWFTVKNEDGNEYFDYIDYKDFCNNPADAWPIISDNRISIMFDQTTEKGSDDQWCLASSPCDQHVVDYISPSKPLRAAMIVFLKMQESKNAS